MKKVAFGILGWLVLFFVGVISTLVMWSPIPTSQTVSPEEFMNRFAVFQLVFVLLSLVSLGLWIYTLAHVLRNRILRDGERILWLLVVVLLNLLGAVLYFLIAPDPAIVGGGHPRHGGS